MCVQHMTAETKGLHNKWKTALYLFAAVSFMHGFHHLISFYNDALHIAAGFQITSILSLLVTVYYVATNRGFVVCGFLAALHIFAWLGFHKYVPRDQHTDDVFPLCSVLFFLCWLSTRLMSQGGNENIVTQLRKEIVRASI